MTQEEAMQKITGGELEYARQYYHADIGTWEARLTADLVRFSDAAAIVTAVGLWLALAS